MVQSTQGKENQCYIRSTKHAMLNSNVSNKYNQKYSTVPSFLVREVISKWCRRKIFSTFFKAHGNPMETLLEAIACDNMSCNAVLQITRESKIELC